MTPSLQKQQGIGMLAALFLVGVVAFIGLFAIRVGPFYFEYLTVAKIAEDTAANATLMRAPKSKVYSHIDKAYRMNNLWDLEAKDTIELQKDGKRGYLVTVKYEKRTPLFSNVHVVTAFEKVASSSQ